MEDVIDAHPADSELRDTLERGIIFQALSLDDMAEALAARAVQAVKRVAQATLDGSSGISVRGKVLDPEGQRMYIESMRELLDLISDETWKRLL